MAYKWEDSAQFTAFAKRIFNKVKAQLDTKQNKLTAGSNVTISGNTINATDTKYTAGNNVTINGTVINAKDTTYTAATQSGAGLMSAADKQKLDNIFLRVYPVGSIYISTSATNPSTYFGGTWEQIQGAFLLGSSASHGLGTTGGNENIYLSAGQMPEHYHSIAYNTAASGATGAKQFPANSARVSARLSAAANHYQALTDERGAGNAVNIMPPYVTVAMFKRIA